MDELDEAIEKAREQNEWDRAVGLTVAEAFYDPQNDSLVVRLENGIHIHVPVSLIQGLADADRAQVSNIEITPLGTGLHWESLDWDGSVPHLLQGVYGSQSWMQKIARSNDA